MTDDVYARLAAAQDAYDSAVRREGELAADAARARAAAQEAAGVADKLLDDATAVANGDVTDSDIIEAREAAKRVQAIADLADAKRQHARTRTLQPQIDLLAAQRDVVQHEYAVENAKLDAAVVRVDETLAAVHQALAEYAAQAKVTKDAHQRCHQHNHTVRASIGHNELLEQRQRLGVAPTAAAPAYFGVAVPQVQLFLDLDRGKISARRQAVPSLSVLIAGRGRQ
jgi:hypothetical protein